MNTYETGKYKQIKNFIFRYISLNDKVVEPKQKQQVSRAKKVLCIDTGVIYNSVHEAAIAFDAPFDEFISRVCRGVRKSYKKHKFKYL